jgi:hypothetical protein
MQTIASHALVAAVVMAVVFGFLVLIVAALCQMALRHGKPFRADLRAASFSLHVSTNPTRDWDLHPDHSAAGTRPSQDRQKSSLDSDS